MYNFWVSYDFACLLQLKSYHFKKHVLQELDVCKLLHAVLYMCVSLYFFGLSFLFFLRKNKLSNGDGRKLLAEL